MRGTLDIETGVDSGALASYAPLAWVIQTNAATSLTKLAPQRRLNAAWNSGAWQAMRLEDCTLEPGVSLVVPVPVLPLPFQMHAMAFTLAHGTSAVTLPVVWELELQRKAGEAWEPVLGGHGYQILPGSLMTHQVYNGLLLQAGRSHRLMASVGPYDSTYQVVTPWILGVFSDDF